MEGAESEGASKRLKVEADEEDEEDLIMQYQNGMSLPYRLEHDSAITTITPPLS